MAEVFRAKPFNAPDFHGYLALKRILPHLAEDDEFITMFIDEARLSVHLQHPNIVRIYELGQFQTSYYILMEFIAGKDLLTLQKRVRKRKEVIGVGNSALIARDMARGLDFAHKKTDENGMPLNIIHRDVSPQNVLVDYLGDVKVIDFGIAKAAVQSSRTQVGVLKGKMGYMSPEQVQGYPLDARSDQFAIGAVLWEMLTNRRLFHGENEFETMRLVKACEVPAPSELNPEVPPELDRIVLKSLSADREHRYPSAAEFADDLTVFLQQDGTTPDHLSLWMREVFAEDLVEELEKRDQFATIVTADDVRRLSMGAAVSLEEKSDVWAGQQPNAPVDDLAFAAQHTVVQAGGFDPLMVEITETEERLRKKPPPLPPSVTKSQKAVQTPSVPQRVEGFHAEGTRPNIPTQVSSKKPVIVGVLASVAVVALALITTAFVVQNMGDAKAANAGTLIINVDPATQIEVFLNGQSHGAQVPMTIENLGVGTHFVEVRAEGFASQRVPVDVKANAVIPLAIQLKKAGPPTGTVAAKFPELADLKVFLNGEEKNPDELQPQFDVPKGVHLLEVIATGHRPWREFVEVDAGATTRLTPKLEPIGFSLRVEGEPNAVVRFAGERVGIVPTTLENVDPRELHELDVRGEGGSKWTAYVGLPMLSEGKVSVSFARPPAALRKRDFGGVVIETGDDWWNIWVDNTDTTLISPLSTDKPLWLPVGKRKVSLRRGYQQHDFEVEVKSGEITTLSQPLEFTWDG